LILLGYEKIKDKYVAAGIENPSKILDDFTSLVGQKFNCPPNIKAEILEDQHKPTKLEDFDKKTIESFRNLRKLIRPDAPELLFNDSELLKAYDLLASDGNTINAAGLLLFGQERG